MAKKRSIRELLEIKMRDKYRTRINVFFKRVGDINTAFRQTKYDDEFLRYFPIAIVAAVETHFRATYAEMLDIGDPYANRVDPLIKDLKIDWGAIRAIEGKVVTSGEIVAHSLPLSNLGDIQRVMNALLDGDFLQLLRKARKPGLEEENDHRDLALQRPDECFKFVARCFELRHIFCHESASSVSIDKAEIGDCLTACTSFLFATGALLSRVLDPDWNLNQAERTMKADARLCAAEKTLSEIERESESNLKHDYRALKLFREAQAKWREFIEADTSLSLFLWEGGSGYAKAKLILTEQATKRRIEELNRQLEDWRNYI